MEAMRLTYSLKGMSKSVQPRLKGPQCHRIRVRSDTELSKHGYSVWVAEQEGSSMPIPEVKCARERKNRSL